MNAAIHQLARPVPEGMDSVAPTQAQRIAAERLAGAATRLSRITNGAFITSAAKAQASALRKEAETLCQELRRAGL